MDKKYLDDDSIISDWVIDYLNKIFIPIENMYPNNKYFELYLSDIDDDTKTIGYIFILN